MEHSMHHNMMAMETTTTMMMNHHDHHDHHNHHNMSSMGMNTTNSNMTGMGGGSGMGGMGMGGSGDHSGHDMSNMHGGGGMHGMKMYFHLGVKEYVLLEACHTNNDRDMVIACVVIFLMAVLYEGLKFVREVMLQRSFQDRTSQYYPDTKSMTPGNSQEQMVGRGGPQRSVSSQILSCSHVLQTFLHILQIFLSYCLMLVFMTYNVWLCVAVVLGAGVGYFVFGWKRAMVVDANEHCH